LAKFQSRPAQILGDARYSPVVSKARIVLEIVTLLQGTPVDDFARQNLSADGDRVVVRCARAALDSAEGEACKRAIATALRRFSYRFDAAQLSVLADLSVAALRQLEPQAVPRVRARMCDPASEEAQRDAAAALAVCERLSTDY
jgi:hypothetical protein